MYIKSLVFLSLINVILISGCGNKSDDNNNEAPSIADVESKVFQVNTNIPKITFVNRRGGDLSNCRANIDLPSGLELSISSDRNTCEITGAPVTAQSPITYTITATNNAGNNTATVSIEVTDPNAITFEISFQQTKVFRFNWKRVSGADHYNILENPDSNSGFTKITSVPAGTETYGHIVPLHKRVNAQYILETCSSSDDSTCEISETLSVKDTFVGSIGYIKTSNTGNDDLLGTSVSLSSNGNTLVIGAPGENSSTVGVNSTPNNSGNNTGAAYVFRLNGSTWVQQAYLKASNTGNEDLFGTSVSLSDDGETVVIGAPNEDSSTTGSTSTPNDSGNNTGAAYVFRFNGSIWVQQAYLKASNTGNQDLFGTSVSLSGDGETLVIGAPNEDSSTTGSASTPNDSGANTGAAYVFRFNGSIWVQQAYLKANNTGNEDLFGTSVSLSGNGGALVIGAPNEDSSTTGSTSTPNDSGNNTGAVYAYHRIGGLWVQQAYLKANNTGDEDLFGISLSLSGDGETIVVGAPGENSSTVGINSTPNDSGDNTGAAYVFNRTGSTWRQDAYIKSNNTDNNDLLGSVVNLSSDGNTLAIGAINEDSSTSGVNSTPNNSVSNAGAAYVFSRTDSTWHQDAYIKASNTGNNDLFGTSISLSGDGETLVIGAPEENSSTTGVSSTPNNSGLSNGAIYLY